MPQVSFIIPAYNEEAYLPRTISALHAAATSSNLTYEIIVVDDASTDGTGEAALAGGASVHRVELRHIAAVRNAGAALATGEILIFVDADTVVPAQTLEAAMAALQAGAIGGGCGVRFDGKVSLVYRIVIRMITIAFRYIRWAAGCFIFCRREAFEAAGGFDEDYYASEEIWMSKALKRQGRFVVLRQHVITSARKARLYPLREMIPIVLKIMVRGPNGAKRRQGLEFWYESRREKVVPDTQAMDGVQNNPAEAREALGDL